ncbi:molybdate ABC transporter permease subunit [Roseofilum casamattae]|uniref:Molybdate ABC transporter permease subunit n=1 Tax=Roseofilum casamattae BLCC-M143 TaxID=3022442 RepID=A0ABT7BW78_9CYAN|nr:molybdate ABC transporter permease subunit [Roseofilum casamattae]MDJ1183449.1 molybdate ABC transporter permease subunit [Roseofilum casamattae BLCC-M143]
MTDNLSPLWISLNTASCATGLAFAIGILAAAWMYSYRGKGKRAIDLIFTLPLVLPPLVLGVVLLLLLGNSSTFGKLLSNLGIRIVFSRLATVIAATIVAVPIMYKTTLSALEQVDRNLVDCARTLGASETRIFAEILLPLAWPGVMAGTSLSFARALGEFGATLMLAGNIPGKTQTIPLAIFFAAEGGRMEEAIIWTIALIAIALIILLGIQLFSQIQHPWKSRISARIFASIHGLFLNSIVARKRYLWERRCKENEPVALSANIHKKLSNFSLNIQIDTQGSPLGILGASGSGKSMTLRCLAGLETPNTGKIMLDRRVLFDSEKKINIPSRQRRMGLVWQNYALFPHLRVIDNIGFGISHLPKIERDRIIKSYLNLMQLEGLENRYPNELSGGQQQRVALARALAIQPDALLLDEPLSALDNYLRHQIEQLLVQLSQTYSGTIILVTHKLEEAYRICDRLIVLSQGNAIANGRKHDIFSHPNSYEVAQLTECKNFSTIRIIDGDRIYAPDWGCTLQVLQPIAFSKYVGIRAHHLRFPECDRDLNTFPCWLVKTSETPHRMTLYLRLDNSQNCDRSYHLQAEVFKEKWETLKDRPFPWFVRLDPLRLILMDS